MQAIFGILVLLFIAWLFSENRRQVPWRFALAGLALHFLLVVIFLKVPVIQNGLWVIGSVAELLSGATKFATSFIFGYVGGGEPPFEVTNERLLLIFGFQVLPQIIVLSTIFALLWYWGLLQLLIRGFANVLERFLKIGGALGLGAASNVLLGMVESSMVIRPYLAQMTRQELFTLMVCGMATISGTVMVLYGTLLQGIIPNPFGHVFIASLIAVPAALVIARIMAPSDITSKAVELSKEIRYQGHLDAITKGAQDGLQVFLNVLTMLIVFVAFVALVNGILSFLPDINGAPFTLELILGWIFAPIAWLMGLPFDQALQGGKLLGLKIILTEFVAFAELAQLTPEQMDAKSYLIMTYGLTGFANFGSLGILVGGLTTMVPERREDVMRYGPKALVAGTLASCLSGAVVGLLH